MPSARSSSRATSKTNSKINIIKCSYYWTGDGSKSVMVFNNRQPRFREAFEAAIGEGTIVVDVEGTAYGESEYHVIVCEGYEEVKK